MTAEITEEPVRDVQDEPPAESTEAPYGWMTDPVTQERRPKKRPGRRSKTASPPTGATPALEELQALGTIAEAAEDTPPGQPPKGKRKGPKTAAPLPPWRAGQIAKVVNRRYRQVGRIVRMLDHDIGTAIIATTRKPDPEDEEDDVLTAGEAWEALAKNNPRVRAWLMKLVVGGSYSDLFNVHLPILLAIVMKESIRRRIPLMGLVEAYLGSDPDDQDDGQQGAGPMMGGLMMPDMAQMMQVAEAMMSQAAMNVPRAPNGPRMPANGTPYEQDGPREHDLFREPE